MAQNTITIQFRPCRPTPAGGYRLTYRVVGSGPYIEWPENFMGSPAIFTVEGPEGAGYEGFIRSDCGEEGLGFEVPWTAENLIPAPSESEPEPPVESPSESEPPPPCTIWQNTGEVNATNVSWQECDGTPMGPTDITPGSNFCALNDTVTGPDEGSLTDMGPCDGT